MKSRRPSSLKKRKSPVKDAFIKEVLGFTYTREDNQSLQSKERKNTRRVRFDDSRSPLKKTLSTKSPDSRSPVKK